MSFPLSHLTYTCRGYAFDIISSLQCVTFRFACSVGSQNGKFYSDQLGTYAFSAAFSISSTAVVVSLEEFSESAICSMNSKQLPVLAHIANFASQDGTLATVARCR